MEIFALIFSLLFCGAAIGFVIYCLLKIWTDDPMGPK